MIAGLRNLLEQIEEWPEIKSIIPGEIKSVRTPFPKLMLVCQYEIETGLKCFAKSKRSVQEVFIVTTEKEALIARLKALFGNNHC